MFKVGDIVELKDKSELFPVMGTKWKVTQVGIGNMTIVSITSSIDGMELYVDEDNWTFSMEYYRRKKIEKICSKLGTR